MMRCLTLATSLRNVGFECTLLSSEIPTPLRRRADSLGVRSVIRGERQSDPAIGSSVARLKPALLVRDGYEFTDASTASLEALGIPMLVIDDNREAPIGQPKFLLNQNLHASSEDYLDLDATCIMTGPRWCLIREDIVARRGLARRTADSAVLISTGGADPIGLRPLLADYVRREGYEVCVAAGLMTETSESRSFEELLASSRLGILAAGSTLWEAACLGLPTVAVISAPNQVQLAEKAEEHGICIAVDGRSRGQLESVGGVVHGLLTNEERMIEMSRIGQALLDGRGGQRVADLIVETAGFN